MRHHINAPFALAAVLVLVMGVGSAMAGPQARISGVVVGTDGAPIAGATITTTNPWRNFVH